MSGRALCIAECKTKPALLTPYLVVPWSIILHLSSTLTRLDAVTSEYNKPNGLIKKFVNLSSVLSRKAAFKRMNK